MSGGGRGHRPTGGGGAKSPIVEPSKKIFRSLRPGEIGAGRMNPVHEERAAAVDQIDRTLNAWRIHRKADGDTKGDDKAEVSQPDDPAEKEADQVADQVADSLQDEKEGDKKGGKDKTKKDKKGDEPKAEAEDAPAENAKDGDEKKPDEEKSAPISAKLEGVGRKVFLTPDPAGGGKPDAAKDAAVKEAVAKTDEAARKLKTKAHELKAKADILKAMRVPPVDSIEATVAMASFIGAANSMYDTWDRFTTGDARIGTMGAAANQALGAAGVLPATIEPIDGVESAFAKGSWTLKVGKGKWSAKPANKDELMPMCTTIYHEARHAEQWTNIAKMLAGRGKSEQQIADETGVAQKVASAAKSNKTPPTEEQLQVSAKLLEELNKDENVSNLDRLQTYMEMYNDGGTAREKSNIYRAVILPLMPWYKAFAPEADAFGIETAMTDLWVRMENPR